MGTQRRSVTTPTMSSTNLLRSKDLSVSQDSLNSIGSSVSTASRSRVRLGVTSLQGSKSNQQVLVIVVLYCMQSSVKLSSYFILSILLLISTVVR